MNNRDLVFCPHCNHKVVYSASSECVETTIRGTSFSYVELSAHCTECGEEVYVPEINDSNVASRSEAYRVAKGLITIAEIKEIMNRYDISAGPLSVLMGFGEVTINRYILGQLPSKDHSEKLLTLKHDREYMKTLLESGKDKISALAYDKCKKALVELDKLYDRNKIDVVARYFLKNAIDITPLALQKLLYYAQAFFYALFKENLFDDDCQAWTYGPVFPEIYDRYKAFGYDPIDNPFKNYSDDTDILTEREKRFLDVIISTFGDYSGKILSEMTHNEKPWTESRGGLHPDDRSMTIIKKETIHAYFEEILDKFNIVNPCDISKYSDYMYQQVN